MYKHLVALAAGAAMTVALVATEVSAAQRGGGGGGGGGGARMGGGGPAFSGRMGGMNRPAFAAGPRMGGHRVAGPGPRYAAPGRYAGGWSGQRYAGRYAERWHNRGYPYRRWAGGSPYWYGAGAGVGVGIYAAGAYASCYRLQRVWTGYGYVVQQVNVCDYPYDSYGYSYQYE